MNTPLPKIASLWIGDQLSWLEQLCLKSFADRGHQVTLYSYVEIPNLPQGVEARDAAEIFSSDIILRHGRTGSPAIHADLWRLHLLAKTDAIWVDSDMYCWRAFDFSDPWVFGLEKPQVICNAVLRLPKDSTVLQSLLGFFEDPFVIPPWFPAPMQDDLRQRAAAGQPVHLCDQPWGLTGPYAATYFLHKAGEFKRALPEPVFFPVDYQHRNRILRPRFKSADLLTNDTKGVHFWARRLKPRLLERDDNQARKGSFLHQCLLDHDIDPKAAPIT